MKMQLTLHTRRGDHRSKYVILSGFKPSKGRRLLRAESLRLYEHETRGLLARGLLLEFATGSTLRMHDFDCTFLLRLERTI